MKETWKDKVIYPQEPATPQTAKEWFTPNELDFISTQIIEKIINEAVADAPHFMKIEQDGTGTALFNFKQTDFEQQLKDKWLN